MTHLVKIVSTISKKQRNRRLDQALAKIFPNYSRSNIKELILSRCVLVNNTIRNKPSLKVLGGETVVINAKIEEKIGLEAQDIPLSIIYEDDDILVINKPHNLVVHPGIANSDGTLLNALLHYHPPIANIPRAGIVHRLDKDTSGLMVIAKTILAQRRLVKLFQLRAIIREYEGVVLGYMAEKSGIIDKPISRHPIRRTHMHVHPMGKSAVTYYHSVERFRVHTHLRLRPETGRTHQIRVHMAHISHPLVGDQMYGGRLYLTEKCSERFVSILRKFSRQALHASILRLSHPITGIEMKWHAPIPQDIMDLIEALRTDFKEYKNT